MRKRLVWKTETLVSYTSRVADDTAKTARQLLVRGEDVLQKRVRFHTPQDSGRLNASIQTEHRGIWEFVRVNEGGSMSVRSFMQERNAGYKSGRGGRFINFLMPNITVRTRILEGSVFSDLPWASDVEYDTGIYNKRTGGKPITPTTKKALAFTTKGGKSIVVASVKGYPGKHMFAKGAAFINASPHYLQNQSSSVLSRWRVRNSIVRPR